MTAPIAVALDERGLLRVSGPDARAFLQGIITNDVTQVGPERAIWSAFLTPQGRFLHEFFVSQAPDGELWLDCEAARREHLQKRLSIYRLRARAEINDGSDDLAVFALVGERALGLLDLPALEGHARALGDGVVFVDPRLGRVGARAVLPRPSAAATLEAAGFTWGGAADYDRHRLALGVPEGSTDLEVERATLMESGFDELHGVSWDKGCYLGQELTARMKYRGLAKKRLLPVTIDGPAPEPGTEVRRDGKPAGTLRSTVDGVGLALLRLDRLNDGGNGAFEAGEARLTPRRPDWANF